MAKLAAGDRQAVTRFIHRHAPGLRRFHAGVLSALRWPEYIAQKTFLRVWRAASRYDPALSSPATWIYRIALCLAIDRNRRTGFRRFVGLEAVAQPEDDTPAAETRLTGRQALALNCRALKTLPDRQRGALLLRAVAGMTTAEIAAVLDISVSAVEQLLLRARAGTGHWCGRHGPAFARGPGLASAPRGHRRGLAG